jgi:hypothetical protein
MENSDLSKPKRKQHRRSVSISRPTYDRLKAYCAANNVSMSHFVETAVEKAMEGFVAPPRPPEPRPVTTMPAGVLPGTAKLPPAKPVVSLDPPQKPKPKVTIDPPKPGLPPSKIFTF